MDSRSNAKFVSSDADDKQVFTFQRNGLTLAGRLHGRLESTLPLVCLPGLTRNSRDFDGLATALRKIKPDRPIVAFDSRGRGLSERCDDPNRYSVPEETLDLVAGLDALGIERAGFLGTSRGVLLILTLAALAPERIVTAIFNDAGPRLEAAGLKASGAMIGQGESFDTIEDAARHVAELYRPSFPALAEADFRHMAEALYEEREDGRLVALRGLALLARDVEPLPDHVRRHLAGLAGRRGVRRALQASRAARDLVRALRRAADHARRHRRAHSAAFRSGCRRDDVRVCATPLHGGAWASLSLLACEGDFGRVDLPWMSGSSSRHHLGT